MRVTKISLATMLALGTLTCASAKTTLEEAIKGTTIGGYVYGQMTSQFGDDIHGNVFRTRAWLDLNTGAIGGFNVGMTGYATLGGGNNSTGANFLKASGTPGATLPVGLAAVYGNMNFAEYGSKTTIKGGKLNILTPFNDNAWDFGYGVYLSNEDVEGVKFVGQVLGAYTLDDAADEYTEEFSFDHPLYIVGIEAGGEKLAGAGIKVYAAHSTKVFDYMVMGDISYTIAGITLQSQLAVTGVDNSDTADKRFADPTGLWGVAKLRGLYNIQASYNNKDVGFSAKAGFTGSFGDGYGALMNYASFNMGGQIWWDINGGGIDGGGLTSLTRKQTGGNGYGFNGVGGIQDSNIMVGYVGVTYSGVKSLKLGLDYAYVTGDNYYVAPTTARTANIADIKANKGATLHEVSFTASYGFFDNKLTLSGLIGSTFGDLEMARGRVKVQYSF